MRTSTPSFIDIIKNPIATIIILLAISLSFLFLPPKLSNRIKMTCIVPMRPLQWATCFCSNSASNFLNKALSAWCDNHTQKQLEEQVSLFKNKIVEQQDTIHKLQSKLYAISKFQAENNSKIKPIPADIIGYDSSPFRKSITVNAGFNQGVKLNDVVVSNNALVGKAVLVSGGSSIVQLITDPASRIPGRVLRTREQVIIEGNATGFCQLKYVPRWAELKKGDEIISSGIGGFYPPSLPVATVAGAEIKSGSLFQSVKVLPRVNISKIEQVFVITN